MEVFIAADMGAMLALVRVIAVALVIISSASWSSDRHPQRC
jgi:hypothetical protein